MYKSQFRRKLATNDSKSSTPEPVASTSQVISQKSPPLTSQVRSQSWSKATASKRRPDEPVTSSPFVTKRARRNSAEKIDETQWDSPKGYFDEVLREAGLKIQYSDGPHILSKDQAIIARDIQQILQKSDDPNQNAKRFVSSLQKYCEQEKCLKRALLPTQLISNSETETVSGLQKESLFRILLTVDCLQTELIEFILDKITDYAIQENEEDCWMRLLLRPMCFLPHIQKSVALATRLVDIVEAATDKAQLELISCLPDILPDSEHDDAAKHLSKLIRDRTEITPAAIECLGHLSLGPTIRTEVRNHILATLQTAIPFMQLPILTQYLLSTCQSADLEEVIQGLRTALDFTTIGNEQQEERTSSQVLTFSALQLALMSSKQLGNAWIKIILSIKHYKDHKPIDIAFLLILHSSATNRKKIVENVMKKRILSGHFKTILLQNTLTKYLSIRIIKEYLNSIIDIAAALPRLRNGRLIMEFASTIYTLIFTHVDANIFIRQEVIHSLVLLTGSGVDGALTTALNVLSTLSESHMNILHPHALHLLSLLDRIEGLELKEVRRIMDILCGLAFSADAQGSASTIQDDLHMLIRKQLNSAKREIQLKGVIGAIMAVKHIATSSTDAENCSIVSEQSYCSISDLPNEKARQAASLVQLVTTSTKGHVEATGLTYDELAAMLATTDNFNKYFLTWLSDAVTLDFQSTFVIEEEPESNDDLKFTMQLCVNDADEENAKIAINIAGLCTQRQINDTSMMVILAPLFRLLRLIQYRQNDGDLSAIDAVLGCAIIMPEIDADLGIQSLDLDLLKVVLDCYFHCANWHREVISAFVNQTAGHLHKKVLLRLSGLIQLEEQLAKFMTNAPPDYYPPQCHFPATVSRTRSVVLAAKKPQGRGRKKKVAVLDENTTAGVPLSLPGPSQAATVVPNTSGAEDVIDPGIVRRSCFRDIDVDILLLLRDNLNISTMEAESVLANGEELGLVELRFIMEDLVDKLQVILEGGSQSKPVNSGVNAAMRQLVLPLHLITDCIRLMPHITKHLTKINTHIQEMLTACDEIRDAPAIFAAGSSNLKQCFGLLLEFQALTFAWPGLQSPIHIELLRDGLRALVNKKHAGLRSIGELSLEASLQLIKYTNYCLHLPSAVNLVKILQALSTLSTEALIRKRLVDLCKSILSMNWTDLQGRPDRGAQYNFQIDLLVKAYLMDASIDTIRQIISWMQEEAPMLKATTDPLQTLSSINKGNFPLLYRAVSAALVSAAKTKLEHTHNYLAVWRQIAIALQGLMNIVKIQEARTNLAAFLRRSLELLKLFLAKGMPILEIKLRSKSEEVVEILRIMQQSTRFLHNLCCHSKVSGDSALIGLVPAMRLTLEALIYRVKAALVANNCSAAFWMGNLRNKNIHGEEILSQTTQNSTQEDDEEQLPADDESGNDSDIDDVNLQKSDSEIF